jgi:cobalt transporter subunit CbtB
LNGQTETRAATPHIVAAGQRTQTIIAAALALIFGLGLVYTTGFAHPSAIHNAAHDTRHALSFPCH